jgi:hypothetical protein
MRKILATLGLAMLALGCFAPRPAVAQTYATTPKTTASSYTFTPREEFEFAVSCVYPDAVFTYDWTDEEFEALSLDEALSTVYSQDPYGCYYYPLDPFARPPSAFLWTD